jgi:hypothetical protein
MRFLRVYCHIYVCVLYLHCTICLLKRNWIFECRPFRIPTLRRPSSGVVRPPQKMTVRMEISEVVVKKI